MTLDDLASLLRGKTEVDLNEDLLKKANLKPPDGFDQLLRRSFKLDQGAYLKVVLPDEIPSPVNDTFVLTAKASVLHIINIKLTTAFCSYKDLVDVAFFAEGGDLRFETNFPYLKEYIDFVRKSLSYSFSFSTYEDFYEFGISPDPKRPISPKDLLSLIPLRDWSEMLPGELQSYFNELSFKEFLVAIQSGDDPVVNYIDFTVGTREGGAVWKPFDWFEMDSFDIRCIIPTPKAKSRTMIFLGAEFVLFPKIFEGKFIAQITSDLAIMANFKSDGPSEGVSFNKIVKYVTNDTIIIPEDVASFVFTDFYISIDVKNRSYSLGASANASLKLIETRIALNEVKLQIDASLPKDLPPRYTGSIVGTFSIEDFRIFVSAEYGGAEEGWTFIGRTFPGEVIPLAKIFRNLMKDIPGLEDFEKFFPEPASLDVNKLSLTARPAHAQNKGSYIFDCGVGLKGVRIDPIGAIKADANLNIKYDDRLHASFGVELTLEDLNIVAIVGYDFDKKALTLTWDGVTAAITEKNGQKIASLTLTKYSLGEMIETFVSWFSGQKFGLAPPWNILNQISLASFNLDFNFTTKQVSFRYKIGPLDLGLAKIQRISVTYEPTGENKGVNVELEGSFLWGVDPKHGDDKKLKWDATKPDDTPMPPGAGNKYFDLRLLALGQHVEVEGITDCKSVGDAIKKIETLPVPSPTQLPAVGFSPESSWMVAADFGILKIDETPKYFLSLQTVFNDPNIYGLRVALAGPAAKVLAGLDFEIMYRRISETVGVYQAQIQLPDKMRNFQMGAFNITLPVFAIELYTNGDFKVDVGFPWNLNFSRSFTIQAQISFVPVIGSGGIYFGKLSGATTSRVPAVTDGNFNPVIVFGLGLQLGVGKYLEKGVLRAGISLTLVGILEGVIARWNPYDAGKEVDYYYYWLQGTIGIMGRLFGSVDFGIVKAEVNVTLSLVAQITYECYKDIPISVIASVDVSLSIKINCGLFKITIHFSFSARIKETFTIKNSGTPPWTLADGSEAALRSRQDLRLRAPTAIASFGVGDGGLVMKWDNYLPAEEKQILCCHFAPVISASTDEIHGATGPHACYVPMLLLETRSASDGPGLEEGTKGITSFERLCNHVLRWTVAAALDRGMTKDEIDGYAVSDDELIAIMKCLSDPENSMPIEDADAADFMRDHFTLQVTYRTQADDGGAGGADAAVFPMPPALRLRVPSYHGSKDLEWKFSEFNAVDEKYLDALRTRFDELAVQVEEEMGGGSDRRLLLGDEPEPAGRSVASFVFADYFLLLARQMVQNARDGLRNFQYLIGTSKDGKQSEAEKVEDIVDWVNDHMTSKPEDLGAETPPPFTAVDLFEANGQHLLNPQKDLEIQGGTHRIGPSDTLSSIAEKGPVEVIKLAEANFGEKILTVGIALACEGKPDYVIRDEDTLESISKDLFAGSMKDLLDRSDLATKPGVLAASALLALPPRFHTTKEGDRLERVAAEYGIPVRRLAEAEANLKVPGLFSTSDGIEARCLNVPHLQRIRVSELIREIRRTMGLSHLSGIASRYLLHGMRLPTEGIEFCDEASDWPEEAGLYALTGQQFPIPALNEDDFSFSLARDEGLEWIDFVGGASKTELSVVIAGGDRDRVVEVQKAVRDGIVPGMRALGPEPVSRSQPMTYPFPSATVWNHPGRVSLPHDDGSGEGQSLRIWSLPTSLVELAESGDGELKPLISVQVGTYNEATSNMDQVPVSSYGWGTLIEVGIKRIEPVGESPSTRTTYELAGANERGILLLERLLREIQGSDEPIGDIRLLYRPSPPGSVDPYLQSDGAEDLTIFISQVNLTTETRPSDLLQWGRGALAEEVPKRHRTAGCLDTAYDFVRMLWENSITRSGGYYLYYSSGEDSGLPESIFNEKGDATISLLFIYGKPGVSGVEGVGSYVNCAVTGDPIDPSRSVVYGRAEPFDLDHIPKATESLDEMARRYYTTPIELVEDHPSHPLADGKSVVVSAGTYMVSPIRTSPGGRLADIASYFNTTEEAIKEANPRRAFECKPDSEDSLATIADRYQITPSQLAEANADHLLTGGKQVKISERTYEVRPEGVPPGGKLGDIASYFNTPGEEIIKANPEIDPWPELLEPGLVIRIPAIEVLIGPGTETLASLASLYSTTIADLAEVNSSTKGLLSPAAPLHLLVPYDAIRLPKITAPIRTDGWGKTFADLAAFYGCSAADLAEDNRSVAGLLSAAPLRIGGGPKVRTATVPAGAMAIGARRDVAAEVPDLPGDGGDYGQLYLQQTFSMLGYRVLQNLDFRGSERGLPMGPVETADRRESKIRAAAPPRAPGELWEYHQALPYPRFAKHGGSERGAGIPDPSESPYAGIGGLLQVNFEWQDIFGNVARTPLSDPSLDKTAPANNPPILLGYTDELIGLGRWPSVSSSYQVLKDGAGTRLTITLAFDPEYYLSSDESGIVGEDPKKDKASQDLRVYRQLYYQLLNTTGSDEETIKISIEASLLEEASLELAKDQIQGLRGWIEDIYQFLSDLAQGRAASAKPPMDHLIQLAIALGAAEEGYALNSAQIFELTVAMRMERPVSAIQAELKEVAGVRSSSTNIPPAIDNGGSGDPYSLKSFASRFEEALSLPGSFQLKVATGTDRRRIGTSSTSKSTWAVRLGAGGGEGIYYSVKNPGAPKIFAPRPISNRPESRSKVPIKKYASDDEIHLDFVGVDMDVWAREFLAAVDKFLTPEYLSPARLLMKDDKEEIIDGLLGCKRSLADSISSLAVPVFDYDDPLDGQAAKEAYRQQLLVRLSNAYATDAVIQFDVEVEADIPQPGSSSPPRLFGVPAPEDGGESQNGDVSLTAAKVLLEKGSKKLTFLLQTKATKEEDDPSTPMRSYIPLDLSFQGSMIEHEIVRLLEIAGYEGGYEASSWLSFVTPPAGDFSLTKPLGSFDVPLVLRAIPTAPSMIGQAGLSQLEEITPSKIDEAVIWDYSFDYSQSRHEPQDEISFRVEFNLQPGLRALSSPIDDLFSALAEFVTVYPDVAKDLDGVLRKIDGKAEKGERERACKALEFFSDLVGGVADAWKSSKGAEFAGGYGGGKVADGCKFSIREKSKRIDYPDGTPVEALMIRVKGDWLSSEISPPMVFIKEYYTVLDTDLEDGSEVRYLFKSKDGEYLPASVGRDIQGRTVILPDLNVLERQSARAVASLSRNEELVPEKKTADPFVYRTSEIQFANPHRPKLGWDDPIDISLVGSPDGEAVRRPLAEHLSSFFENLFKNRTAGSKDLFTLQLECIYEYHVNPGLPRVTMPVLFVPSSPFDGDGPAVSLGGSSGGQDLSRSFVGILSQGIWRWFEENSPHEAEKGTLKLGLTLLSDLTEESMPLLRLTDLSLPLDRVTDLPKADR
jgi:hypothetical protein